MAQETMDYINEPIEAAGGHSAGWALAEMGLWIGGHWASGIESRAFGKYATWKGSARATNAYYSGLRRRFAGLTAGAAKPFTTEGARYASALNLMQRRGGGFVRSAAWKAAGRRGVLKQFATLAASRLGAAVYAGLNISLWAPLIFGGAMGAVTGLRAIGRNVPRQEFGERFFETQGTYTERQRAVQAITSSRLSTRAALGSEAALMHR
jgi:hypothetical protein